MASQSESTSVIADFKARAVFGSTHNTSGSPCRVILSKRKLAIATQNQRVAIPLGNIFDVIVSQIPPELEEFFDQTVIIGYTGDVGGLRTVAIEGETDRINKFGTYLYKSTLQGRTVKLKHPARQGGRILDTPRVDARIHLESDAVRFAGPDTTLRIDLSTIIDVSYMKRTIDGNEQPVTMVKHLTDDQTTTSEVSHPSMRKLNILTRYLRLQYFQNENQLRLIDLTPHESEALVALYSANTIPESIADSEDAPDYNTLINTLEEKGLITDTDDPELTSWGQLAVIDQLEETNV